MLAALWMQAFILAESEHPSPLGLLFRTEPHSKSHCHISKWGVQGVEVKRNGALGAIRLGHGVKQGFSSWRDGLGQPWPQAVNLLAKGVGQSSAQRQQSGQGDRVSPGGLKPLAVVLST